MTVDFLFWKFPDMAHLTFFIEAGSPGFSVIAAFSLIIVGRTRDNVGDFSAESRTVAFLKGCNTAVTVHKVSQACQSMNSNVSDSL